jgi:hypothetical protein
MSTILDAFDGVFAPSYQPAASWRAWRTFIKAVEGERLTDAEMAIYTRHTGRREQPPAGGFSEVWVPVGRGGGKSSVAAGIVTATACFNDWTPRLRPGEVGRAMLLSMSKDQAGIIHGYCVGLLESDPTLRARIVSVDKETITLTGSVEIVVAANSFRTVRGHSLILCVLDECAFYRSEESGNPDVELFRAVKPGLGRVRGSRLIGISSPYAKKGILYDKTRDHYGVDASPVLVWMGTTEDMFPDFDRAVLDAAFADDPTYAQSEYGRDGVISFRSDVANFLDMDLLRTLTREKPPELGRQKDVRYHAAADPSGGRNDAYSLAISHHDKATKRVVVDLVRAMRPPFNPSAVVAEYAALLKTYGVREVTLDGYAAEIAAAPWRENGIEPRKNSMSTSDVFLNAQPLFSRGAVEIPDLRPLLLELSNLERRVGPLGKDSVGHPRHSRHAHDDMAAACCASIVLADKAARVLPLDFKIWALEKESIRGR